MPKINLYESIINKKLTTELEKVSEAQSIHKKALEVGESNVVIASYLKGIIEKGLGYYGSGDEGLDKQIEISNKLVAYLKDLVEDEDFAAFEIAEQDLLRGVADKQMKSQQFLDLVPVTSVAESNLFTGSKEDPMVYSELKKEIGTADRVDLLVSFIKHSGLRLIMDELIEHTRTKPLRVITTSYMGASDYSAIKLLAELPNTEVRISYDTNRTRLHAKAYYFHRDTGFSTAYIGSSNMSKAALTEGTEWNLKVSEYSSRHITDKYKATFESYWNMNEFQAFDPTKDVDLQLLKRSLKKPMPGHEADFFFEVRPFGYQQEILDQLEIEREIHGSYKNLVVAATGTGKTVVSAFDFKRFYKEQPQAKLLFLAHRKEILDQSLKTFRGILRDSNFGDLWVGGQVPTQFNHVFASVQTLNRGDKFLQFKADDFDYIVLDETHHSAAISYKRLIGHFEPKILLGLTATPERMDGESILGFFNDRIVDEIRLAEAIDRKMLSPFHYFGVSEDTDLRGLKWSAGRYDVGQLNDLLIQNQARDQVVLRAIEKYLPDIESIKGLGFCCSKAHAKYMSDLFNRVGIPSTYLESGSSVEERRNGSTLLKQGQLKFIFVVDLYNEGVDIPEVNTVLFLRPTESSTIFIQQLGRGLRIHEDKEVLTVLDFIGQAHKSYDVRSKFQSLVGRMPHSVKREIEYGFPSLPKSCFIQLERVAKERIFSSLKNTYVNHAKLQRMVDNFTHESSRALTLEHFLNHYHLDPKFLYKFGLLMTFKDREGAYRDNPCLGAIKHLHKRFYKFCDVTSVEWIDFLVRYIDHPDMAVSGRERKLLLMTYYTFYKTPPKCSITYFMGDLFRTNRGMVEELKGLLLFNRAKLDHMPKALNFGGDVPLELHGIYTVDQILTAMDVHGEDQYVSFREGVKYVKDHRCDVFFVTLNKNEKDYNKTTMYKDYAISESLFHWQSQSRTSVESPTGQRYVNQRTNKNNVLLFVRDHKQDEHRQSMGYRCLGFADYVSHEGSKPISITYKLRDPMPVVVYRESAKVVGVM
jgi:superfamily II DNA or RNA helicase/HKD family nuclease